MLLGREGLSAAAYCAAGILRYDAEVVGRVGTKRDDIRLNRNGALRGSGGALRGRLQRGRCEQRVGAVLEPIGCLRTAGVDRPSERGGRRRDRARHLRRNDGHCGKRRARSREVLCRAVGSPVLILCVYTEIILCLRTQSCYRRGNSKGRVTAAR